MIGVNVEGSSLLNRLVEGERQGEADARGEDRPKLEVAQVGEKVAGTLLVKIHLFRCCLREIYLDMDSIIKRKRKKINL